MVSDTPASPKTLLESEYDPVAVQGSVKIVFVGMEGYPEHLRVS